MPRMHGASPGNSNAADAWGFAPCNPQIHLDGAACGGLLEVFSADAPGTARERPQGSPVPSDGKKVGGEGEAMPPAYISVSAHRELHATLWRAATYRGLRTMMM
jgi:hypothetical protein